MAHAQKPDFVFRRNGRVHLDQQGRQFSPLLAAKVCASVVVMLDTPSSEVVWRVLATHSIRQFPLHFLSHASPCVIMFQLDSTKVSWTAWPLKMGPTGHHKTLVNKYQSTLCKNPGTQRTQAWKWRQYIPLQQWYLSDHMVSQSTALIFTALRMSVTALSPRTITHKATNRTLELHTIVSSMGYVVLSGKIHVDKHETTFWTPVSKLVCSTLSLIWMFLRCKQKIQ